MESAAGVEAAALGHVRRGDFLLQGLVDEAAVLAVDEAGSQDHGGADDGATAATLGQTDGEVSGQKEDGQGDEDDGHDGPESVAVPGAVATVLTDLLVLLVFLVAPG